MKQKIMTTAGSQCFEFEGEITEIEQDYLILKAKHGDIYIERKHLVFIQYQNEEESMAEPRPANICCPWCTTRHVDTGEWETRAHHKHLCLACKKLFRVEGEHGEYFYGVSDEEPSRPDNTSPKVPKLDAAAKFISQRLKHDPLDDVFEEMIIPPSQLPDDDEVTRNVHSSVHGAKTPVTQANNLRDAVKTAMKTDEDFSMGGGSVKYQNPAQTILGRKNAEHKKS